MASIVLPGDTIPAPWLQQNKKKTVGNGIIVLPDKTLQANVAGVLRVTENAVYVESNETRYLPKSGDLIVGTVIGQTGDFFKVDIGGPQSALLSFLSFEGATKRNRPQLKVGSLVYAQVVMASKNVEPELSCVDMDGRAEGMGIMKDAGIVVHIPLNYARRLLQPEDKLLKLIGKKFKCELVVGMNGQVLIIGSPRTVTAIYRILDRCEDTFEVNYDKLVDSVDAQEDEQTDVKMEE
ncbi:unnamed protein product [Bursaphelenchus okinawaensis]|uniref:Ribosomal RNA-processing protein 40 n=1 Tax=Bursaphelenchus okinawaensis TaxID=465554 RepID=A0A811JV94_9BILA|nr:unnamed protein product [Bursaphelenchus okinawaensis]CAG9085278.1 unnamed protein product [Bursaphelenchus okinawaensis]